MASLLRRLSPLRPAGARMMSGHSIEHAIAETDKWKKISYVFIPFIGLYMGFVFVRHNSHEHGHHEQIKYGTYIKKRDKPMPWALKGGSDCDLFDYECGRKYKAAQAAKE